MHTAKLAEIAAIVAAAVIVYQFWKSRQAAPAASPTGAGGVIPNSALPGQAGYGWNYYDGGIAIDPNGAYYLNGVKVWAP